MGWGPLTHGPCGPSRYTHPLLMTSSPAVPSPSLQPSTNASSPRKPSLVSQLQGSQPLLSSTVCSLSLLRKQRPPTGRPHLPHRQILLDPCQKLSSCQRETLHQNPNFWLYFKKREDQMTLSLHFPVVTTGDEVHTLALPQPHQPLCTCT